MKYVMGIMAMMTVAAATSIVRAVDAPVPVEPVPSARQLEWEENNFGLYLRFGINTFTGEEVGTGKAEATVFNPQKLDARQWVRVAKENGAKRVVLVVKGHEGFCLWPTATTDYSVKSSPWRDGKGDVLREFSDACREAGMPMGLQVSVEDLRNPTYGTPAYNAIYLAQLREVLTAYGDIDEVRFDGAGGEGAKALPDVSHDSKKEACDWKSYFALVRELQPNAIIVSNVGPDARWNGNNIGHSGEPNWAPFNPGNSPELADKKELSHLNSGDESGKMWCPAECLVPMRTTWFWHDGDASKFVAEDRLFSAFCKSTGRNCSLLFNVPIDAEGLISDADVTVLHDVHGLAETAFATDLAAGKPVSASNVRGGDSAFAAANAVDGKNDTYWATDDAITSECSLEVDLGQPTAISIARMREPIALGQRVETYRIEIPDGDGWKAIVHGKGIGHEKIERFTAVTTSKVRLVIEKSRASPAIAEFSLYGKQ
jgi:alpha-L-fucosidase